jgi:hypothetical protein
MNHPIYGCSGAHCLSGGRGGNRTHNPRLRRPVLYPIELLAHSLGFAPIVAFCWASQSAEWNYELLLVASGVL